MIQDKVTPDSTVFTDEMPLTIDLTELDLTIKTIHHPKGFTSMAIFIPIPLMDSGLWSSVALAVLIIMSVLIISNPM